MLPQRNRARWSGCGRGAAVVRHSPSSLHDWEGDADDGIVRNRSQPISVLRLYGEQADSPKTCSDGEPRCAKCEHFPVS